MFCSGTVKWQTKLEGRVECSAAIVDDFSQVQSRVNVVNLHASLFCSFKNSYIDIYILFFCRLLLDVTKVIFTFFTPQMATSAGVFELMARYGNTQTSLIFITYDSMVE